MKRLIPAIIILVFTISVCISSHIYIKHACNDTLDDIKKYQNQSISASALESSWEQRKDKMSIFINRGFLDKISIYIGRLTVIDNTESLEFNTAQKNIATLLSMIKTEQRFAAHSFF